MPKCRGHFGTGAEMSQKHFGTVCATVFSTRFYKEGRRTETGAAGICTHVTASSQRLRACPSRSDGRHAAASSRVQAVVSDFESDLWSAVSKVLPGISEAELALVPGVVAQYPGR